MYFTITLKIAELPNIPINMSDGIIKKMTVVFLLVSVADTYKV